LVTEQLLRKKSIINPQALKIYRLFPNIYNTYASVEKLRKIFDEALSQEDVSAFPSAQGRIAWDRMLSSY